VTATKRLRLSATEQVELIQLLEQRERELVSPKMNAFRDSWRVKIAIGGRGAGAKTTSAASLIVQKGNYRSLHGVCLREHLNTLEESSWKTIAERIDALKYPGWKITDRYIDKPSVGTHLIFRGLSDYTADSIQSLQSFDLAWCDEGQRLSAESCVKLFPTIRKPGSEIWVTMNPDLEIDPVIAHVAGRQDVLIVRLKPGKEDNPWWTDVLEAERVADFARDPELAEHVWNGSPRVQGERAIFKLVDVIAAMARQETSGDEIELGVDVARFGSDRSQIYKRKGLRVTDGKTFNGADTQQVARFAWDMAERNPNTPIKVDDSGVGGGVTDKLRDLGSKATVAVLNGNPPNDKDLYTTCADEQWFTFPMALASIPDDQELKAELSTRNYSYTPDDRRKIESKESFKKRYGRSPDKADALMLCFYSGPTAPERGEVVTLNVW
jgi:phage terminase large subunit